MAIERRTKLVILHSNDMHGDFVAEAQGADGKLIGGLALLSGYINRLLCRLARKLTHPRREEETELGNLVADVSAERSGADVVLLVGGELGPIVTLSDLRNTYSYDGVLVELALTGAQLTHIFAFFMAPENHHEDGKVYQVNAAVRAVHDNAHRRLESLQVGGQPVQVDRLYSLCLLEHHFKNSAVVLNLPKEDLTARGMPQIITTSTFDLLEEYLGSHQNLDSQIEGRLVYL